jgi:hypothetical protein
VNIVKLKKYQGAFGRPFFYRDSKVNENVLVAGIRHDALLLWWQLNTVSPQSAQTQHKPQHIPARLPRYH